MGKHTEEYILNHPEPPYYGAFITVRHLVFRKWWEENMMDEVLRAQAANDRMAEIVSKTEGYAQGGVVPIKVEPRKSKGQKVVSSSPLKRLGRR